MRVRQQWMDGDYKLSNPFLVNSPACVAQVVMTRLKLWQGEWFMDVTDGMPWSQQVLGKRDGRNPDAYIKQRILSTQGVTSIASYTSTYDGVKRTLTVQTTINTLYGQTQVSATL